MGNDELCHPQDPKRGQEPVHMRQSSFLQLLLPGRAPLPLTKAKLAFACLGFSPAVLMPCGATRFGGFPSTRCAPNAGWWAVCRLTDLPKQMQWPMQGTSQ